MKRLKNLSFVLLLLAVLTVSCRDEVKEKEVVVKEVEVEKKVDTPEEREGILERTAKKVDKEVNEEIDKKIENIGDDNS